MDKTDSDGESTCSTCLASCTSGIKDGSRNMLFRTCLEADYKEKEENTHMY